MPTQCSVHVFQARYQSTEVQKFGSSNGCAQAERVSNFMSIQVDIRTGVQYINGGILYEEQDLELGNKEYGCSGNGEGVYITKGQVMWKQGINKQYEWIARSTEDIIKI